MLEFNVEAHPDSLDALDKLANAYLQAGNRDAALKQLQKMLEIKPDSSRIRAQLAQAMELPRSFPAKK